MKASVPGADTQDGGHAGGVVKKVCQRCHSLTAKTNAICPDESVSTEREPFSLCSNTQVHSETPTSGWVEAVSAVSDLPKRMNNACNNDGRAEGPAAAAAGQRSHPHRTQVGLPSTLCFCVRVF